MKSCPRCYHSNPMTASVCERCATPFDGASGSFTRTCPAGRHVMDPAWSVCAFCKAEGASTEELAYGNAGAPPSPRKTVFEGGGTANNSYDFRKSSETVGDGASRSDSSMSNAGSSSVNTFKPKETVYGGKSATGQPASSEQRKIIGVLITYTWKPEGELFPVREGRNLIGREKAEVDIHIASDSTLSRVNTTINCQNRFMIQDKDSTSGTWVNDKVLDLGIAVPLANYDRVRAGSTTFTFISINPVMPDPNKVTGN